MTEVKKDTKDSKEVIEEPESDLPPSQKNLEGGLADTIAPEQLVEALKQQAAHIPGGNEAIVTLSAQVPTAGSEVLPQDYKDLPAKAEEITKSHEENFKNLAASVKDSPKDAKREQEVKAQEVARKDMAETEKAQKAQAEKDKKNADK